MPGGRCLVLNASYEFLHVTDTWFDSLRLLRRGKVVPLVNYPQPARGETEKLHIPAVAMLRSYVSTPRKRNHFGHPSKRNVLIRDKFTCQYCGCRLSMGTGTKDHVMPSSRGGQDTLTNVVAACKPCNNRKGDRTPAEAGMKLMSTPRALTEDEKMDLLVRVHRAPERALWRECLNQLKVKLF